MKRLFPLFLALLIPCAVSAGSATLHGTILVRKSGTPLPGAFIAITTMGGTTLDTATTDASGNWSRTLATTGVAPASGTVPQEFGLGPNYPNPFNPSTHLPFHIGRAGNVRLTVHNLIGQLIDRRELTLPAGSFEMDWRSSGSAGVLFYSIEVDGKRLTRKMIQLDGAGHGGFGGISVRPAFGASERSVRSGIDSVRIVATSLIYEPDTVVVPLLDGVQATQCFDTIHERAFFIDLHNDFMEQDADDGFTFDISIRHTAQATDIPRMRDGGLDGQNFSDWIDSKYAPNYYSRTCLVLDSLKAIIGRNSHDLGAATTADSALAIHARGAIAVIFLMEGGECIESDLNKLRDLYSRGMRVMTITWNDRPGVSWARAHNSSTAATIGLNGIGASVIHLMDSLGIIIDVSHVGTKTVSDILTTSVNPIIASHSNAWAIQPVTRNLTDAQILAIAQRGGVIGINFYPPFVGNGTVNIDSVIKHIDHIKAVGGIDCLAIGADFDGFSSSPPTGLKDVSYYPALTEALLRHGYTRSDIRKILGENFLRVFRTVCR